MDRARIEEIAKGVEGVTPGPWAVYDGCSWRRIGTAPVLGRDYDDCAVLYPNVASDGHPDMNAGRGQDTYANLNHIARLDPQTVSELCRLALIGLGKEAGAEASAEAWCRIAGSAIDALDEIAGWEMDALDESGVAPHMAQHAEDAAAKVRAAYPPPPPSPNQEQSQ